MMTIGQKPMCKVMLQSQHPARAGFMGTLSQITLAFLPL